MSVRCDQCGAVSRLEHLYVREPGLQRMDELHCPACHRPEVEEKPLPGWPGAATIALLLLYWLFIDRAAWPLFLLLLFPALTILHELLHAIPAWLLGARVLEIHVGGGERPSWRIGGVRVAVTNWLVGGGFCAYAFRRAPAPAWRHAIVAGLPLLFHLLAALVLLRTGIPANGEATVLQVFALVNAFLFLQNVYPSDWSDGHFLFCLARRGRAWAETRSYESLVGVARFELDEGRRADAIREAKAVESWMPRPELGRALFFFYMDARAFDDAQRFLPHAGHLAEPPNAGRERERLAHGHLTGPSVSWLSLVRLRLYQDRLDDALEKLDRWSASEDREEVLTIVRSWRALVLLELDRVEEADQCGREAFACMPWLPLVRLVYGAVLVRRGALAGGVEQLAGVKGPHLEGIAAAWLAIGHAGLERHEEAKSALARSREGIGAPPSLTRRAERAVSS